MKVLVVDDEADVQPLFMQRFRKEIKSGEVEFSFALSGEEALNFLHQDDSEIVLILSDINMPGMSGLNLLKQIKQEHQATPPFVMMTAITEHFAANVVVNLLNGLFDKIVKEIIAQDGQVDKFIGDAVMVVFTGENHLQRAITAALAVKAQISTSEKISAGTKTFKPEISIGINSGEMVSGNIGSVSLKRLDYTVIGDSVNTAQRLQSAAKPGQILVNEHVFQQVKEVFNIEKSEK